MREIEAPSQTKVCLKILDTFCRPTLTQSGPAGCLFPGGESSESVAFLTRNGAQVSAPVSGKVEFSGAFRSYGQLLILSTSDGYHVLLWGMSSSYVSVGQSVRQGEPVAKMSERASGAPELNMEVRKGGKPMDPANWMKRG